MRPDFSFLRARVGVPGALLPLLLACASGGDGSDDDGPGSGSCGLGAEVSGGASLEVALGEPTTCVTLHSSGTGIWARFIAPSDKGAVELDISDIAEGETATYPATVIVENAAKRRWQGTCLTNVSEHTLLEVEQSDLGELRSYQIAGEAICADPLTPFTSDSDEPVTVASLDFRARVTWRN